MQLYYEVSSTHARTVEIYRIRDIRDGTIWAWTYTLDVSPWIEVVW